MKPRCRSRPWTRSAAAEVVAPDLERRRVAQLGVRQLGEPAHPLPGGGGLGEQLARPPLHPLHLEQRVREPCRHARLVVPPGAVGLDRGRLELVGDGRRVLERSREVATPHRVDEVDLARRGRLEPLRRRLDLQPRLAAQLADLLVGRSPLLALLELDLHQLEEVLGRAVAALVEAEAQLALQLRMQQLPHVLARAEVVGLAAGE